MIDDNPQQHSRKTYWLERWERNDTGFHQNGTNPYLLEFWHTLQLSRDSTIFVPLCGKSQDMLWLRQQGHAVRGVELSTTAAQAFFSENALTAQSHSHGRFMRWEADDIAILCGDFFDLSTEDMRNVSAVYDRAALIALPPDLRKRYVEHLLRIVPANTQILLIKLDYPQYEMTGPPFAVSLHEVTSLFRAHAGITLLSQHNVLAQNPRFSERGVSRLEESAVLLKTLPR
ncbi:thiopurine S-methyltransferase [Nitrosomonas oligotropha]|uniref:thiopurine S-methyltransferase n=1 Tax=Nitrosomonas oligotropha TaxID=42354 RepID=UPI00136CBF59|nr:thiopurine S-methyltransferase [Nitrosomonas oligotropha]MXS82432.1 thiopurine S-methyltransferase [Nitrosomonas oligotropha]